MTGIIINDSIVLVTTVDDYAETRGLVPSIVEGAADRLRPIMLTTMTTVLGLAPLLFERSQQAQFLKPTVITLVYGLGFGMVMVLLVVPALMAMQQDVARQMTALRRGLRFREAGVRGALAGAVAAMSAWFVASLGWVIATGATAWGLPMSSAAALGAFVAGSLLISIVIFAATGVVRMMRRAA
jgi:predicted RND superfamily exporter protein